MKSIVIIPTYNELENIEQILHAVMDLDDPFDVLVVDDGSPDGTAQKVKTMMQQFPKRIHLLERSGKQGLGTAYIAGFKYGLAAGYDYLFEMDADFSHNPKDLPRLLAACTQHGADVAIGSRYVKGGGVVNWPRDRKLISKGGALYTRLITWMPVKDPTAGFICYSRAVLEAIPLDEVQFVGYAFQIEMKYRAWKKGFKIKEVPITFIDRSLGESKMSKGIIKEAMYGVWRMKKF